MKKSIKITLIILSFLLVGGLIVLGVFSLKNYFEDKVQEEKQKRVEEKINFDEKYQVEVYSDININDLVRKDEIIIVSNPIIDTNSLGTRKVKFDYKYAESVYSKEIEVEVVDTTRPTIFASSSYTVNRGSTRNFVNYILAGDNYDDNPLRKIRGEYDLNKVGKYPVTYYIRDSSGNENEADFTIKVVEPSKGSSSSNSKSTGKVKFTDVVSEHKNEQTEIGIDVSKWQGKIDFEKVKQAGCEFVIIRLGHQSGVGGELIVDPYFETNIKNAKKYGLKVGVYLYTYARSEEDAVNQAKWVYDNIKDYDLELGVSYDWESWTSFSNLKLSYHSFTDVAETFMDYLEGKGYRTMLYSSKYYLENIWLERGYDVWLAHYTTNTNYKGKYYIWQRTSNGKIDGIDGAVDIDILYKDGQTN